MNEPFVPTGRELDEGVTGAGLSSEKEPKVGLLKRLWRRSTGHGGRNLTDVHLELDPHIAAKPAGVRPRRQGENAETSAVEHTDHNASAFRESQAQETVKPTLAEPHVTVRKSAATRITPPVKAEPNPAAKAEPKPATKTKSPQKSVFIPSVDFVAATIALSRSPIPESAKIAIVYLERGTGERRELIEWWLGCHQPTLPPLPNELVSAASADLLEVAMSIEESGDTPMSLNEYQVLSSTWDAWDGARRELERRARDYPSLNTVVALLRQDDLNKAAEARNFIDYDSAAWKACNKQINRAISSLEAVRSSQPRPVMANLPRLGGGQPPLIRALLSTLATPSSIGPVRTSAKELIESTEVPTAVTDLLKVIYSHGVRLA